MMRTFALRVLCSAFHTLKGGTLEHPFSDSGTE